MSSFSGVPFVFKEKSECIYTFSDLFRFHLYTFIKAAALRSILLRHYAGAPTATRRACFFFPLVSMEMSPFPEYFLYHIISVFSLYNGEYVVRFSLPGGVFLPCDHGLDFFTSAHVRIQSINQYIVLVHKNSGALHNGYNTTTIDKKKKVCIRSNSGPTSSSY